jgi:Fic family protein
MEELFQWVKRAFERDIFHPLLITANTVFEFLCIHPFKDGNGRVSRVLTNLLLLKTGYDFTRYASHEKLIEGSKVDYYLALRKSTKSWRSGREDVSAWTVYFLDIVLKQIQQAVKLIRQQDISLMLSERQRRVWELFVKKSDLSRKEIHEATAIPLATVEQIVRKLVSMHVIEQYGEARAARYRMKRMMPPFTSEIM